MRVVDGRPLSVLGDYLLFFSCTLVIIRGMLSIGGEISSSEV